MLESGAKSAFIIACSCNVAFSIMSLPSETPLIGAHPLVVIGGAGAFLVATVIGVIILFESSGLHRAWVKAALVFLALGPLAFWFLQWPAASSLLCFDCTIAPAVQARAIGDIVQSQFAMTAVALAALFCAARATTTFLEELAD
jgi:hypothetical protein